MTTEPRPQFVAAVLLALAVDPGEPDPHVLAGYVLRHAGDTVDLEGRPLLTPGGFWGHLIETAFRADPDNLARIGAGFPGLAAMVEVFTTMPAGAEAVRLLATNPVTHRKDQQS